MHVVARNNFFILFDFELTVKIYLRPLIKGKNDLAEIKIGKYEWCFPGKGFSKLMR